MICLGGDDVTVIAIAMTGTGGFHSTVIDDGNMIVWVLAFGYNIDGMMVERQMMAPLSSSGLLARLSEITQKWKFWIGSCL
jgi:hypothetical protein